MISPILLSFAVILGASVIALPCGIFLAFAISRCPLYGRRILQWLLGGWLFVPLYVQACAWGAGFGNLGWWTMSRARGTSELLRGVQAVIWLHAVDCIPWVCLWVSLGLHLASRPREDAAMLDGGLRATVFRAWLPTTWGWIALSGVWCAARIGNDMLVTNLYQVRTVVEQIYLDITIGEWQATRAILSCVPAILIATGAAWGAWNFSVDRSLDRWSCTPLVRISTWWKGVLSLLAWALVSVLIVLPLFSLVVKAGWEVHTFDGQLVRSWNIGRFIDAIVSSPVVFRGELWWSTQLAVYGTMMALTLAIFLIPGREPRRGGWTLGVFIAGLCIALPGPVVNRMLAHLFLEFPMPGWDALYDRSLVPVLLALQFRLCPLSMLWMGACWRRWYRTNRDWIALEGHTGFLSLRKRFVSANRRELLLGTLLLSAIAYGEFSVYSQLLPPNVTPISKRIFELLHYGVRHQEAGVSLFLTCVGMGAGYLVTRIRLR